MRIPYFDGFNARGFLQFHPKKEHFRYVRSFKDKVEIYDGPDVSEVFVRGDPNTVMLSGGWSHYICCYERKEQHEGGATVSTEGTLVRRQYERYRTGGMFKRNKISNIPVNDGGKT